VNSVPFPRLRGKFELQFPSLACGGNSNFSFLPPLAGEIRTSVSFPSLRGKVRMGAG